MLETSMSGLMSGDGNRDGACASTRARPRLYQRGFLVSGLNFRVAVQATRLPKLNTTPSGGLVNLTGTDLDSGRLS